jgi:hypothetical protein
MDWNSLVDGGFDAERQSFIAEEHSIIVVSISSPVDSETLFCPDVSNPGIF